jgi:hypothetical protein
VVSGSIAWLFTMQKQSCSLQGIYISGPSRSSVLHCPSFSSICKVGEASIYQYGGDFGAFFDFGFVYLVFGNSRYVKSCS